jgi:hypothetical protein
MMVAVVLELFAPLNKLNIISYKNRFPPEGGREGGEKI